MLRQLICLLIFLSPNAKARVGACEGAAVSQDKSLLDELPSKFTMAVWNVHKFLAANSVSDLARMSTQSELVLIQESVVNKIFSGAMQDIAQTMHWAFSSTFATREGLTGVVTGCRAAARRSEIVTSDVREPITNTPKAMIFSEIPIEGSDENLLVANVHAINFVNLSKFREQIDQISSRISRHEGPVIVAGDFNTWSRGRKQVLLESLQPLGIELAHSSSGRYLVLDHILTRGLRLNTVINTDDVRSSDHRPLMVQVELEKPQTIH